MVQAKILRLEILTGWKQIANHLGRGVRTVQRYEREMHLPIRRVGGKSTGSVIATKAELDAWIAALPIRQRCQLTNPIKDNSAMLKRFGEQMKYMDQLRRELRQAQKELTSSIQLLRENLRVVLPEENGIPSEEKSQLGPRHSSVNAQLV